MPLLVPDAAIASDQAAVHPREPDTAWFVPEIKDEKRIPREGKLVVTCTRDGGKSFKVLTRACRNRTPMTSSIAMRSRIQ